MRKISLMLIILLILPIVYADVPEKNIAIDLEYNKDSLYDEDNDGEESVNGVVDLTVENTQFSWDVDESKLCTRWKTYSKDEGKETTFCYGSEECCNFIELAPSGSNWDEPYYATFNRYGAGLNNIVSAQVIYYDVNLSSAKVEILNSKWSDLPVKFYYGTISPADSIEDKINSVVKYGISCSFNIRDKSVLSNSLKVIYPRSIVANFIGILRKFCTISFMEASFTSDSRSPIIYIEKFLSTKDSNIILTI